MKHSRIAGLSATALATGLGIGVGMWASADTPTPSPTPTTSASSAPADTASPTERGNGAGQRQGRHGDRGEQGDRGGRGMGVDLSGLATKLGVTEADLSDAVRAARQATKPTAPPSDPSTQTEAARLAARTQREAAFAKALAKELGIDEAKVSAALQELRAERDAQRAADARSALDQAVTDGKLTRAEADAVLKAIQEGIVGLRGGPHR